MVCQGEAMTFLLMFVLLGSAAAYGAGPVLERAASLDASNLASPAASLQVFESIEAHAPKRVGFRMGLVCKPVPVSRWPSG